MNVDPASFEDVKRFMVERNSYEQAFTAWVRFVRDGGDPAKLIDRLCETAPRAFIRAIEEVEEGRESVVRRVNDSVNRAAS